MSRRNSRIRKTTPKIEAAAIELRHQSTPAEKIFWKALRGRKLGGFKFRCQHPVENFILDFYCPRCKLVIELDGEIHDEQQDYDSERTKHLESYNYTILCFQNQEVMQNLEEVLLQILQVALILSPSPRPDGHPSPKSRRGE